MNPNVLYYSPTCHHCHNVESFIQHHLPNVKSQIEYRDVTDPANAAELKNIVGQIAIPTYVTTIEGQRVHFVGDAKIIRALKSQFQWPVRSGAMAMPFRPLPMRF